MEGRVQHDAHELNRLLIDALEKSLKKTVGQRLCQELYEGKCVNQILCLGCGQLSERVEQFYDLNLQVVSCNNAVQALHQYCREELLQGDSAYQCDRCRSKQTAYRACKIDRLPSILTISCNRFKIDQSTNWNRVKVTTRSEYPLMMHGLQDCLDQYDLMHRHASDQKKTQPHDDTSHQQQASLNQSMTWIDQMYQAAKEFLDQHPELLPSIGKEVNDEVFEASLLSHSFPANAVKSFKETILKSSSTNAYQLHGIIVHQGTAYSGHYYAYIHDTLQHANQEVAKKQLLENLTKHVKKNTCTLLHEKSQTASTNAANAPVAASVDQAVFNHSHPLPTPVVTVAAAPEMVVPDFLFNEDLGTYVVDENTALGYVIQALLQYQQQYQISKSEISSASKASKKPNQVKKGSGKGQSQTTSSANDANSRYVTSSWIVEEVGKSSFGNDKSWWISLYQDHFHGISFDDYLQQFRDSLMDVVIWTVRGKQEIRFAMKDNTSVLLLSSDDLRSMFGEIAVNSAAATTAAVTSQQDDAKVVAALGEVSINDIAVQFPATSAFTNNGEDGWQVVRKEHVKENQNQKPNKKQKKFKKDKNQSSTENPDTKESSDVVDQQASRLNLQECYMIESLLHEVFGRYLQFNDQYVNCMSYQDLYDCFVGVNSAYLLIYRLTSSVPTTISNIPKYWHEKIAEQNQLLLRERQDYEVGASRITVNCFLQSNFNYQYPFFQVSATEEGETLVPMKLEVDANTSVLQIIRQVLESTVSHDGENRTQRSEQQLGDLFMSQFSLDNSINSDSYTVDEMISFLHLSKVEHIQNKFYYPLDPLAHESFAKDVIQSSNALLLWMQPLTTTLSTSLSNAFSFRDVVDGRICFGREQRPRLIGLKSLQTVSNRSTAFKTVVNKKKSSSNLPIGQKILCPLQCEERFCYVPAHFTMLQSVQYMLYLWHVHAHTSSLSSSNVTSAWPYFLSKDKFLERILFLPSPTLGETDIKDTDALLQWIDHAMVHLCLPSLSCFDDSKDVTTNVSKKSTSTTGNTDAGNWTVIFKEGSVQTSNSLLAYSSSTYFGDLLSLCSLRDVYLEDERQQGVHSDSLLKRYLELQQQASYQTVYLDVDRSFMQVWSVQTNGEDFSIASETITLKLPALKNVSLYAFKEEVLALFGDSGLEMMPFAQLRLLDDDNEDQQSVLLSDDLTITQASSSTKDNIRMRLVYVANDQLASLKSKDSNQSANIMKLTVVFKCASATLVKTEEIIKRCLKINSEQLPQAENHFEADDMKIQVEVRPTDHIKRIRDIVGILLFDFPEGWTSYEHDKTSLEDFCVRSKQQLSSDPTGTEEEKLKLFRESSLINFEGKKYFPLSILRNCQHTDLKTTIINYQSLVDGDLGRLRGWEKLVI